MVTYREAGVELIQARGQEGRFEYRGTMMRLGAFSDPEGWYVGVHESSGVLVARLSLEYAKSLKEATDMLKYGFFLQLDDNRALVNHLREIDLLSVPTLS